MAERRSKLEQAPPGDLAQQQPRNLHPTSDIRFALVELGKLDARITALTDASKDASKLQIAAIIVGLLIAAFGAWGIGAQLASLNAKIDRLEDKLGVRLDKADDRLRGLDERVVRLEATAPSRSTPAR